MGGRVVKPFAPNAQVDPPCISVGQVHNPTYRERELVCAYGCGYWGVQEVPRGKWRCDAAGLPAALTEVRPGMATP